MSLKVYWEYFDKPVMMKDPILGHEYEVKGEYKCDHPLIKRCWVSLTLPVLIDELGPDEYTVRFHAQNTDGHIVSVDLDNPKSQQEIMQQATDLLNMFYE